MHLDRPASLLPEQALKYLEGQQTNDDDCCLKNTANCGHSHGYIALSIRL